MAGRMPCVCPSVEEIEGVVAGNGGAFMSRARAAARIAFSQAAFEITPPLGTRSARAGAVGALVGVAALMVGCGGDAGLEPSNQIGVVTGESAKQAQTPLSGNAIPKFVDALPPFAGRRIDGTATVQVSMQEFQQKVLPASVYAGLSAPFRSGTFLWGYNINNLGASWPARTIEARQGTSTSAIYTNSLTNTRLQSLLTVDQALHWADPLHTP